MSVPRQVRAEDGFTLLDVIFAAMVSIVIVLAVSATLGHSVFYSQGHQRQAAVLTIAQREIESVHQVVAQYGFTAVAMSGQPGSPTPGLLASNPDNPDDFVTGSGASKSYMVETDFHDTSQGTQATEPLVVNTTLGRIAPISSNVTSGAFSATVHRYVTVRSAGCTAAGTTANDCLRVIIAVVPNVTSTVAEGTNHQSAKPVYVMTQIDSPVPTDEPGQTGAGLRVGVNIG